MNEIIGLLQSLPGLEPGPGSLYDGFGPDFLAALLAAFPDSEPTSEEIAAFERSYKERG